MMNALKLAVTTPSDIEIVMTRQFRAPRRYVWDAMTKPEWLRRWMFSPEGWTMTECTMDVRVGGKYRWAWSGPDGKELLVIWGEHREVTPPHRIVHTERMEMGGGCGGGGGDANPTWELLATLELTEQGDMTLLTMTLKFPSKEARDGALATGMEQGVGVGYQKLDGLLAEALKK